MVYHGFRYLNASVVTFVTSRTGSASPAMGAFVDMCSRHCKQEPSIDGTRPLVAFAQWYAGVGRNHTEEPLRRLWLQRTSAPFNAKAPYCPSCCSGGT